MSSIISIRIGGVLVPLVFDAGKDKEGPYEGPKPEIFEGMFRSSPRKPAKTDRLHCEACGRLGAGCECHGVSM